ncbi:MAG: transpeptidase family protein [Crocinitomicaceae bacterium]|nr:transpeptidase family protein [Crocinitomicaceae bacterium]
MSEKKDIYWRAYLIYFGFVVLMLVILIKTISIQFEGSAPMFMSSTEGDEKMPTRTVERAPRRGQILDANYTPLVTSVSFYDIHMDPTVADDEVFDEELTNLSVALNELYPNKKASEYATMIRKARARGSKYLLIKKRATNEERKKLRAMPIFELGRLGGGLIDNEETIIRKRPHGELMKRTLGYVKWDDIRGESIMVGIEGAFNSYLQGEAGEEIEQRISTGWKKIGPVTKEPVEGANIVTTIDMEIQEVAHAELLRQLQNQEAKNGCAIVMDVKTGHIKAIVNLRRNSKGEYKEVYNQAIGTKEVPGSTFKLASLMALLEDNKVKLSDRVNAKGVYKFYDLQLKDSNHGRGYGMITVQEAFEKSSNVFSNIVNEAYKSEPHVFINRLKSFGLADSLGLDLVGEPKPTMYEPGTSNWYGTTLPWMAIGYEVLQTPLQTLALYNAVANNGTLVKPQFVKEVRRGNEVIKTFAPVILKDKICSDQTLIDVRECLYGAVKRGTGSELRKSAFFEFAGKTGTALVLNDDLQYGTKGEKKYQASFAGYFPADNPIYSCIVVISAPSKDIYGAKVSGTVFTAIANKVYASSLQYHEPVNSGNSKKARLPISKDGSRYDLKQSYEALNIPYVSKTDAEWVNTITGANRVEITKRFIGKTTVPNVKGMTAKDAVYLIEQTGMVAKIKGYGKVVEQSISPGETVFTGGVMEITLK